MQYGLGVDLGTSSTVAAVRRPGSEEARLVQLGSSSYSIPSVVAIGADATLLAGEAAERRAATHPTSAVREFKRRFGDPAPIVVEGQVFTPEALMAAQLADVLDRVERSEGSRPTRLVLTHPAAWGPFRLAAMRSMADATGVADAVLVPEPVAAAVANRDRLADGALVAVYDLGGGTFDAAVVRCSGAEDTWAVVGTPEGVERLGGADIDQAVLGHVDAVLGGQVFTADAAAPETRAALLRLRTACREAKEQLSEDTDVEIPVELPGVQTRVRLTRTELETMIRPRLADSLAVLDRVVASAGATWDEIDAVLLVGGSSRIPAVGQMVQEHAGRPVLTATNPQLAVALGAARFSGAEAAAAADPGDAADAPAAVSTGGAATPAPAPARPASTPPPAAPAAASGATSPARRSQGLLIGAAVGVIALAVGAFVVFGGGGDDDDASDAANAVETTDATGGEDTVTTIPSDTDPVDSGDGSSSSTVASVPPASVPPASASVAPTDSTSPTTPPDDTTSALLRAADLVGTPCVGALPSGEVTGLAVDGDLIAVAVDGGVQTVADDPGCAFGAPEVVVPAGSGRQHVAAVGGALLSSGDGGAEVRLPNGSTVACPELLGPVALNEDRVAISWDASGRTARFEITAGSCALVEADVYPDLQVTAGAFVSANAVVLGVGGGGGPAVTRFNRRRADWDAPLQSSRVDAVTGCGSVVCALDREAGQVHLIDADGEVLGSITVATVAALAGIDPAVGAVTMAAEPGGSLLLVVDDGAGSTQLVRVGTQSGG